MKTKTTIILTTILLICAVTSCKNNHKFEIVDGENISLCKLQENIDKINVPRCFDIINKDKFLVSDNINVYLYDMTGTQIRKIGHSGNAPFEYSRPTIVKYYNDSIYVWSSATLKFITFAIDGNPGTEYKYPSALTDFQPAEDNIYIYTAGTRSNNIIDIYCKSSGSISNSLIKASEVHQCLLHNVSTAPIHYSDNQLIFMPKDSLIVYCFDESENKISKVSNYSSQSFSTQKLQNELGMMDRKQRSDYIKENPMTLEIFPAKNGKCRILSLEGKTLYTMDSVDNSSRFYGLYCDDCPECHYSFSTIGCWHLFSTHKGNIYYIGHEISDEEDIFTLKQLKL